MTIRHRLTGLAAAAFLAVCAAAAPAAASARTATGTGCQHWYVLGLHGLGEGPDHAGDKNVSPELTAFADDLAADGAYGHATEKPVPYPTITASWQDAAGVFNQGPLWQNVQKGVANLQGAVKGLSASCPGSRISMFGYSEGAWIINVWEQKYPAEASGEIYSAGLIGDPCFADIAGDAGLARLFTHTCGDASLYIVGETNITPTNTDCLAYDPVCGLYYLGTNNPPAAAAQLATAATCKKSNGCPHFLYVKKGDVASMAIWMLTDIT